MVQYDMDENGAWIEIFRLSNSIRVARKEHSCSLCEGAIKPGEYYRRAFYLVNGAPYDEKSCGRCKFPRVGDPRQYSA